MRLGGMFGGHLHAKQVSKAAAPPRFVRKRKEEVYGGVLIASAPIQLPFCDRSLAFSPGPSTAFQEADDPTISTRPEFVTHGNSLEQNYSHQSPGSQVAATPVVTLQQNTDDSQSSLSHVLEEESTEGKEDAGTDALANVPKASKNPNEGSLSYSDFVKRKEVLLKSIRISYGRQVRCNAFGDYGAPHTYLS